MSDFVIYNGQLYPSNQVPVSFNNRSFKFGDSIFESIRCNGHFPLHFNHHYKRMIKAMLSLHMEISSVPREEDLCGLIIKLLQKKKQFGASRVRVELFRRGEGLYTPEDNRINYLVESKDLKSSTYKLNTKGLLVDVYGAMQKMYNPISFFKNGNSLHYVLAAIHKKQEGLNDSLLININNKIIEASSSNLFWIKDGVLFTPSVFSGCVDGVMRNVLIEVIKLNNVFNIVETQGAEIVDLLNADELFLTNAIQGIQWVVGFKEKRFFNQSIKKIMELLNDYTFNSNKG